jgi:hypothetical protein
MINKTMPSYATTFLNQCIDDSYNFVYCDQKIPNDVY